MSQSSEDQGQDSGENAVTPRPRPSTQADAMMRRVWVPRVEWVRADGQVQYGWWQPGMQAAASEQSEVGSSRVDEDDMRA